MNVLVLMPYLYDTVPGQRFRIEQWARPLAARGIRFSFHPFESPKLKEILHQSGRYGLKTVELLRCMNRRVRDLQRVLAQERWDLIYLYREVLPIGPPLLERFLHRTGIPMIYDFDDAIFLPDVSEANRHFKWLKWPQKTGGICRWSTHVVVGNKFLRDYVQRYTSRVSIVPTTIDTEGYTPKEDVEIRDIPVIGWSGSHTTLKHLYTIEPVLRELRKKIPFRLKVIGKTGLSIPGVEVESKGWSAASELEDLKSFDVGIMPLPQDQWSLGKCGLKALQYMAVGVPTIASPVGVNSDIIQDGENGFIAAHPREWIEKLMRLIGDGPLRRRFAREGRQTVEERYSTRTQAPRLQAILEEVCGGVSAKAHAAPRRSEPAEDILCFSSIDWDFIWQGHQEIMTTLARQGHRVLFVENTGVRGPRLGDVPRIRNRWGKWRRSMRGFWQVEENLVVFSPLVLPFPYSLFARWINRKLITASLRNWMEATQVREPVCWTFLPTPLTLDVIGRLPHKLLIYYCIDSFADSTPAAKRILRSEQSLMRQADLVFVTSHQLFQQAALWNKNVHLFPFGVNMDAFEKARQEPPPVPEEIARIREPIIGYVGGIHQWVDQDLVRQVARSCPNYSFVFVGPVQTNVETMEKEPNILLLGQKDHDQLPRYIRSFHAGIIPYRITEYTKNVYPTKMNEYLAMGKPVVSTPLPEVTAFNQKHNNLVEIGRDASEFRERIEKVLGEKPSALGQERADAAGQNAWTSRIEAMQKLTREAVRQKGFRWEENWLERLTASVRVSRWIRRGIVLTVAVWLLIFHSPLMWWAARPLVMSNAVAPADAIVVFAGGVGESGEAGEGYQERVQRAVELFQKHYASRILFISGFRWTFRETDLMALVAENLGVPDPAILKETDVQSTKDYILRVQEVAGRMGWKSILLVTSPYHGRRADLIFRRNVPGLKIIHAAVPESSYYTHGWGMTWEQLRGILHEYASILYYFLRGWV